MALVRSMGFLHISCESKSPVIFQQLEKIMDTLSREAAEALAETDWRQLHPALLNVQGALSKAFLKGIDRKNGLYFANDESLVAFVATLVSTQDNYHDIGIAFKNNVAYLCNKGFGIPDSGISAHPLSHRKIQKMKSDISINSYILMAIGRETAKDRTRWHMADLIIDKTKHIFPALSAFISSLKITALGA